MPSNVPPVRNSSFSFTCRLADQANAGKWKSSPTLASGDVKVRKDGGSANNITTLPTASGTQVTVTLTATEMDADEVVVEFIDAAGNEWGDLAIPIYTVARRIDDLAFPATSGRSMAVDASGNVAADAKLLNGSSTPITNLNTVFNTDFASNYNATADRWKADLTHANGTAVTSSGGVIEVDTIKWANVAVGSVVLDVNTIQFAGQAITCGAAVTIGAYLGGTAAAATQTSVDNVLTAVQNVQNNTFIGSNIPQVIERPDSGTEGIDIVVVFNDADGSPADIDASADPTLLLFDSSSNNLSARVSSWSHPATGKYTLTYTSSTSDDIKQIHWEITGTVNGKARRAVFSSQIVDTSAVDFTSSDRSKLEALYNKLPSKSYIAGTNNSDGDIQINEATGTPADPAGVTTLLTRIPSTLFSGITYLSRWLGAIAGKTADTSTRAEINATPAGAGFNETSDSQEAIRDNMGTAQTGDAYAIVNNGTYGNAALQSLIAALSPASDTADSFTQTYGTVISNTYTSTETDDNTRHVLAPEVTNGLDAFYQFDLGANRSPINVKINGYFNGTAQYANIYAYDYESESWALLTNSSTRMNTRSSDLNYNFTLAREYMSTDGNGTVKIRFVSPSTNTAHRLYIDQILVFSLNSTGGEAGITPQNVWEYVTRELTGLSVADVYHADIDLLINDANSRDEYTITWFKNGVRQSSGITSPTIQVVKRSDGTDLIASSTPTQIGSTGSYKHDATTTARITDGSSYLCIVTATIDSVTREFSRLVGRDG